MSVCVSIRLYGNRTDCLFMWFQEYPELLQDQYLRSLRSDEADYRDWLAQQDERRWR